MHGLRVTSPSILPLMVEGLSYHQNGRALIDGVSFVLPAGGITALIGPNGAGKSLLMRLCHGLIEPSSGSVRWSNPAMARKRQGMVFQRPVMLRRSLRSNIAHAIAAHGETQRTAEQALDRFGLKNLSQMPARLLSGGEQQRLAIARAWALEPDVLFLDEPTSQLDPGVTRIIEETVSTLAAEGVTIVITTHDLAQAKRLAQRVLFMDRGEILEDSPPEAFFAAPETPQARSYLRGDLVW